MDPARLDALVPLIDPTAIPRVVGRDEALRRGFTSSAIAYRLRLGRWRWILPHTYLTSDTLTRTDRLRAALEFAGPESLLSGAAALDGLGLRGVAGADLVLVLVPPHVWCRATAFVQIRRTTRLPLPVMATGLRRAPVARAVADLALRLTAPDDVRMLVAEVVRRGLCTVDEIVIELDKGPRNGSARLRCAAEEIRAGAWSAPEARAATVLRRAGAPPFEQNAIVHLPGGDTVIVDFLWRALRAVLEIDSDTHHALAGDADRTSRRHLMLETAGFTVVHHTPRFVREQPAEFARGVLAWLVARGLERKRGSARSTSIPGR